MALCVIMMTCDHWVCGNMISLYLAVQLLTGFTELHNRLFSMQSCLWFIDHKHKGIGVSHKTISPKTSMNFPRRQWGWLNWGLDIRYQSKMLSNSCHGNLFNLLTDRYLQASVTTLQLRLYWLDFSAFRCHFSPRGAFITVHYTIHSFMDMSVLSFVSHSPFLTAKSVDLMVPHDGFLFQCVIEIVHIFHSGYFDYKGAFRIVLNSLCCVMGYNEE